MAHKIFGLGGNVFLTFCFFVVLEIASQTQAARTVRSYSSSSSSSSSSGPSTNGKTVTSSSSSSSSSSGTSYNSEINRGELGIRMKYDKNTSNKLNVVIYYDTETKPATDFFQNQFTKQLFQGFDACDVIDWKFMPCGTSRLDNENVLNCPKGHEQCKYDKIHACVATLSANNQQKLGQFIICFFNHNKHVNKCIGQIGLTENDVDQCVQNKGASKCNKFFRTIHPNNPPPLGGSHGIASSTGTTNFKGVLCDQLKSARLQCNSMCPNKSG